MGGENTRPIIVRKRRVAAAPDHHGGAWKVAYADFVTAMMAFFMLMWLLNATTDKQRKGLADYFSPTVAVSRSSGGGDGALGGRSIASDAATVRLGTGGVAPTDANGTTREDGTKRVLEAALMGKGGDSLLEREEQRHVTLRLTDEGTVIELFDLPGRPLFDGAEPTALLRRILVQVAPLMRKDGARVALDAFTASEAIVTRAPRAWPLSTDRAQAVRAMLPRAGFPEDRIARLTGHADRAPADADPLSVRNNRIEIVLLRRGSPR